MYIFGRRVRAASKIKFLKMQSKLVMLYVIMYIYVYVLPVRFPVRLMLLLLVIIWSAIEFALSSNSNTSVSSIHATSK